MNNFPKHFIRYGTTAEQKYITQYQHLFNAVALNANMLVHASKSISTFLHKDIDLNFFIDPMTHAFQHDLNWIYNEKGEIKTSISKLIAEYAGVVDDSINNKKRPLRHTDLNNNSIVELCHKVLNFQKNFVRASVDEEYKEYIDFLKADKEPMFLVAPYFFLTDGNFSNWFHINSELISKSMSLKNEYKKSIFAQLVIDKKILKAKERVSQIIQEYSVSDGLLIWVDGFDEARASEEELSCLRDLVSDYKKMNPEKPIVSLYGGYFAQLLTKCGLDGVVHGLEYGEKREVVPVGGGIPRAKFYIPALKQRFDATSVIPLFYFFKVSNKDFFASKICGCKNCDKNIHKESNTIEDIISDFSVYIQTKQVKIQYKKGNVREVEFPILESKHECLIHYLIVKHSEYEKINKSDLGLLLAELENSYNTHEPAFAENELNYLMTWKNVLDQ
ncbi:MAG: hypothetical protein AB7E49_09960 [Campylobacterales bacterium]